MKLKYIEKLEAKGYNPPAFAKEVGICRNWAWQLWSGRGMPSAKLMATIQAKFKFIKPADFF